MGETEAVLKKFPHGVTKDLLRAELGLGEDAMRILLEHLLMEGILYQQDTLLKLL